MLRQLTAQCIAVVCMMLVLLSPAAALATSPEIIIGTSVSYSGEYMEPSIEQFNGLRLWRDHVNAAGGIRVGGERYRVRITSYDDRSDATRIPGIYEHLIHGDEVDFLFSPYSSSLGAAVAAVADRHGMIALLPGSASEEIFANGYTSVYQLYPRGSSYFAPAVELLAQLDPGARLALLYKDDPFSRSTVSGARELAGALGLNVVYDQAYSADAEEFTAHIAEMLAARPDALIGGGHVVDGVALAQQLAATEMPLDLVALLAAPATESFGELGDAALGVLYPSPWEPGPAGEPTFGPGSRSFVEAYEGAYGAKPQYFAASGYNAGLILQQAIEAANSVDAAEVRIALEQTEVVTFYGHIQFSTHPANYGLQMGHTGVLVQWQTDMAGTLEKTVVWAHGEVVSDLLYPKP